MNPSTRFTSIDAYHAALSPGARAIVDEIRQTIRQAAPDAVETISYNMPAFKLNKRYVYYGVHKSHVGFYPGAAAITERFVNELADYKTSKGAVQFPFDRPVPHDLVARMVKFRFGLEPLLTPRIGEEDG